MEKSRSLEIFKVQNSKRDVARELEKENERLSPSKGGQRTYFAYYPLFLHVRGEGGECTQEGDRDIIMIIVLSILLFFLSIFYVFGLQANTSPKSKCAGRKNHTQGLATGL